MTYHQIWNKSKTTLLHVEQELPTIPDHLSFQPVFNRVLVARYLVFCVVFCISLFTVLSFFYLRFLIFKLLLIGYLLTKKYFLRVFNLKIIFNDSDAIQLINYKKLSFKDFFRCSFI
jgi:hypothetical protein